MHSRRSEVHAHLQISSLFSLFTYSLACFSLPTWRPTTEPLLAAGRPPPLATKVTKFVGGGRGYRPLVPPTSPFRDESFTAYSPSFAAVHRQLHFWLVQLVKDLAEQKSIRVSFLYVIRNG